MWMGILIHEQHRTKNRERDKEIRCRSGRMNDRIASVEDLSKSGAL